MTIIDNIAISLTDCIMFLLGTSFYYYLMVLEQLKSIETDIERMRSQNQMENF